MRIESLRAGQPFADGERVTRLGGDGEILVVRDTTWTSEPHDGKGRRRLEPESSWFVYATPVLHQRRDPYQNWESASLFGRVKK